MSEEALLKKVDDSFWIIRVIGSWFFCAYRLQVILGSSGYPPLPNDHDGFSCGAHK